MKTYDVEFDEIIKIFTHQNDGPLKIEDKFNLTLLIKKWECKDILYKQEQENIIKDMDFYHLQEKTTVIGQRTGCCKNWFQKISP